ncbi:MATE family efflux transporter [Ralstonia pseudosolanacearum]|uniref:MATE family efflux transporter n=1 Tax=Ralstonia solanacearum TaxID=305 RepID=A0AA92IGC1_RALSL|nr:MATE family efflux transporter [Ralstonia pseudosolanacearum]QCX51319.1 MATE family efflux transporter [Ralstonia pseudosolanacearum]
MEHLSAIPVAPGRPMQWHRRVLALAFPIVLANLTQPLLSAVDTAVAGHLPGPEYLGGVALGGVFFNFVFWGFGFLRMGTTGLVAQAHGAGDARGLRANVARALLLALGIGLALLVLQGPAIRFTLALLGASDAVTRMAGSYCHARIWSAPFALANYVVLGTLLGRQQVRLALLLQVFINLVNMAAVLGLVLGAGLGVGGIGAATAVADILGFALGMALLRLLSRDGMRGLPPMTRAELLARDAWRRLMGLNADIFLRTACLLAAFGWFAHAGAQQGDVILAANALLLNFLTFMAYGLDGFAHAAEALVGAALGARDGRALRSAIRVSTLWSVLGAALFSLVYAVAGGTIIGWLTDQPAVREAARHALVWAALLPVVSVWGFQFDGVFIGATRTRELLLTMAFSALVFGLLAVALLPRWGNPGLWFAMLAFMALRGMTLGMLLPRVLNAAPAASPQAA